MTFPAGTGSAEVGGDPYAYAMAKMVLGLQPQALAEFAA